jgi:hypothetical protein
MDRVDLILDEHSYFEKLFEYSCSGAVIMRPVSWRDQYENVTTHYCKSLFL